MPRSTHRNMPAVRRTALSNGKTDFLDDVNANTLYARRFSEVAYDLRQQLSPGSSVTPSQDFYIRRIASLTVAIDIQEAAMANGEDIDGQAYTRNINTADRMFKSLGLVKSIQPLAHERTLDGHAEAILG